MKAIRAFIIFLIFSSQVFAQPGPDVIFPTNINLNQYQNFPRELDSDSLAFDCLKPTLGIITIDSTSDLSLIPLLKREKFLSLKISTSFIPAEIKDFKNTLGLHIIIEADSTDLIFLNEFPQLQTIHLQTTGNVGFSKYLSLDSLKGFEVSFSEELTSLKALKKINSLERISLRYVPKLREFPEFDTMNQVKYVQIYQESGDGCTDCLPDTNHMDLTNLKKLQILEELKLSNVNGITKIPNDLSKELRVFQIFDVLRANQDYAMRSYINDVSAFANYENLDIIDLTGVHIKEFKGNFEKLKLKELTLHVYGLQNISGIFTFDSIGKVNVRASQLRVIQGARCEVKINKITFESGERLENIDFLLMCPNINSLTLICSEKIKLPSYKAWKIPDVIITNGNPWFYIRTENGILIKKSENFDNNIK